MKLNEVFSEEFIKGMRKGIEICQHIAKRDGAEIYFPDLDEMEIEKVADQLQDEEVEK